MTSGASAEHVRETVRLQRRVKDLKILDYPNFRAEIPADDRDTGSDDSLAVRVLEVKRIVSCHHQSGCACPQGWVQVNTRPNVLHRAYTRSTPNMAKQVDVTRQLSLATASFSECREAPRPLQAAAVAGHETRGRCTAREILGRP